MMSYVAVLEWCLRRKSAFSEGTVGEKSKKSTFDPPKVPPPLRFAADMGVPFDADGRGLSKTVSTLGEIENQ